MRQYTDTDDWNVTIQGQVDEARRWTWQEFRDLSRVAVNVDIHCVTSWLKFETKWEGVSVDTLLDGVETARGLTVNGCEGTPTRPMTSRPLWPGWKPGPYRLLNWHGPAPARPASGRCWTGSAASRTANPQRPTPRLPRRYRLYRWPVRPSSAGLIGPRK